MPTQTGEDANANLGDLPDACAHGLATKPSSRLYLLHQMFKLRSTQPMDAPSIRRVGEDGRRSAKSFRTRRTPRGDPP
jgi:hypothetical protein